MVSKHKWRYTSAEMAELILANNDENSDNFSLSSNSLYRDNDEDFEQIVFLPFDSDEPCSNVLAVKLNQMMIANLTFLLAQIIMPQKILM